jgi:hypothetical protein
MRKKPAPPLKEVRAAALVWRVPIDLVSLGSLFSLLKSGERPLKSAQYFLCSSGR